MKRIRNKQKIWIVFLSVIMALFSLRVGAQEEQTLDGLIHQALTNNPRVQSAFHQWKAAQYKVKNVKSLDDPKASYTYFGEEIQTRVGPQENKYGFSQKVPFPGKLKKKGQAQQKKAAMLEKEYEAARSEIIKQVKYLYYDLFWVDNAIEVNEEEKAILEKLEGVAQRKYESNYISQQDVIKVQVELSKIIQKNVMLKQNRKSLEARLNSLLNRSQKSVVENILVVDENNFDKELEDVLDQAQSFRQELLVANLGIEKAEYEKSLAKMAYLPDFTIGAEYVDVGGGTTNAVDDGQDAWMGMISVNVPIWFGKLSAKVKEKQEVLKAAEKNKEDVSNQVEYEVQDLYFKVKAYQDIVLLYETALLPQAEQAFEATQTGFETGSVSFLDWLDTERTYLQTRLAYFKSIADYHKSIAYLERVVGKDL